MQQEKGTVSQESHVFTRRQLASMTLPFILDSLSIMLISMLITALISSAGESSVAAVNLVSPIFTLIVCLMNGISAGGTVEIAQSYGSRDMERMNLAAGHILWMTFLSGTALSLVLILFPRPILTALYPQAEPEVLEKAVTYMVQGSFSLILFTIYTGIFCILRGLGASGKCLCLTIVINVAYLLFSILFLNVWKLDILGSALAQIAARALGSGCALVFLLHPGKLPIHITRKNLFVCRRDVAASILRVSVPFGLEQIFLYGGNIVIEGGFFYTNYNWRGFYYVLNQKNNNPGTITVKGGTFVNYDPSQGDDNLGGSFVADGYSVVSEKHGDDTWYTVVKDRDLEAESASRAAASSQAAASAAASCPPTRP